MTARAPDPDSERYARYWEPVLAPAARRLLQRIDEQPADYLDVGAGTGTLMLAAHERWPGIGITALDASAGMLSVARQRMAERVHDDDDGLVWLVADAADMPLEDASIDVATSSFMLQLVADRPAVLAEIQRVLRPDGVLGLVTWIADDLVIEADEAFAAVVAELGLEADEAGFRPARTTDYETLAEVHAELAVAGFVDVDVRPDELRHGWTREAYLEFKEHYDQRDLFESASAAQAAVRERLRSSLLERWAALPDEAFVVSGQLVSAVARRPLG